MQYSYFRPLKEEVVKDIINLAEEKLMAGEMVRTPYGIDVCPEVFLQVPPGMSLHRHVERVMHEIREMYNRGVLASIRRPTGGSPAP